MLYTVFYCILYYILHCIGLHGSSSYVIITYPVCITYTHVYTHVQYMHMYYIYICILCKWGPPRSWPSAALRAAIEEPNPVALKVYYIYGQVCIYITVHIGPLQGSVRPQMSQNIFLSSTRPSVSMPALSAAAAPLEDCHAGAPTDHANSDGGLGSVQ